MWWRYQLMDPIGQCEYLAMRQCMWCHLVGKTPKTLVCGCKLFWQIASMNDICLHVADERVFWVSWGGEGGGWCVWGMEVYREGRWATPARPWKTLSTHYTHTKSSSLHCFQKSILLTLNNALLPSNELSKEFLENLYIIIDGARQTINPRKSIYNIFWMSGGPLGPNFY